MAKTILIAHSMSFFSLCTEYLFEDEDPILGQHTQSVILQEQYKEFECSRCCIFIKFSINKPKLLPGLCTDCADVVAPG